MAVTRTARRLRQEAGSDLSPTALTALASVERHGPVTPTGLAELEGVKRPTATRVINHLAEAGMIERHPDPEDGRSCRLELTKQGIGYLEEHRSRKSAYLARLLDSLPADDVKTLDRAAEILNHALLDRPSEKGATA
ncbi:MAG: MarR family transcriptional regulator [Solirubrobacterales bacterium]